MFYRSTIMIKWTVLVLLTLYSKFSVKADDVLGCNGFVKSEIDLDFSKVEVKLFTKQGSLKDHTECAPNNGYYFLPLYDKGEYVLKVSSPPGWSFEPSEVSLTVDGVSDPCSQGKDINFVFKGFAVIGQVVSGEDKVGPKGVDMQLIRSGPKSVLVVSGQTTDQGRFQLGPVPPGHYIVRASHPRWRMKRSEVQVRVEGGNGEVAPGSLSVAGYDVTGQVISDGQPITGVTFVLFTKSTQPVRVWGCETEAVEGFTVSGLESGLHPVCYTRSSDKGIFTFPQLSPGKYLLVPHYSAASSPSTKFDVHPKTLAFTLAHTSLRLPSPFQVKGFTVSGRVLWSEGGKPMAKARVLIDGKPVGETGLDGVYHLENMRAGVYTLMAQASGVEFTEREMKISATTVGDIWPDRYLVSGRVKGGEGVVLLEVKGDTSQEVATSETGEYSVVLPRGSYTISVKHSSPLRFSPEERKVEVEEGEVKGQDFSLLKCSVRGRIVCMSVCPLITVNLRPRIPGPKLQTIAKGGQYELKEVSPGEYDVFIEPGLGWCWNKETETLVVSTELTEAPTFVQTGYTVTILSLHSTKVVYYTSEDGERTELTVSPASTQVCVPWSGPITFEPVGCHGYAEKKHRWVSGVLRLSALTHANSFTLESSSSPPHPPAIKLTVTPTDDSAPPYIVEAKPTGVAGVFEASLQLREGERVMIDPKAPLLLFTPPQATLRGASDCTRLPAPLFTAQQGRLVSGRVTTDGGKTGLKGATVNIFDENEGVLLFTQQTSPDGSFNFPPIRMATDFRLTAEKEGYVITGPNENSIFSAHKLAEINVKVTDKADGQPLQGVLLSLSGGESYRRTAQTNPEGQMSFLSLRPGDYYLRPMMKEYRFLPANKIISVKEGATLSVTLSGERVAFSSLGEVTSLNGEGEAGVTVEAVGQGNCSIYQEEATSGPTGHFRIRGLHPFCEYRIGVKEGPEVNLHIQKTSPVSFPIKMGIADVEGVRLYALRPIGRTDVSVFVSCDSDDCLKSLRVRLSRDEPDPVPIFTTKLSEYRAGQVGGYSLRSVVVQLPPLVADARPYLVTLESSLSPATHEYTLRPLHFTADTPLRILRFRFGVVVRRSEAEVGEPSYVALVVAVAVVVGVYHRASLSALGRFLVQARIGAASPPPQPDDSGSEGLSDLPLKRRAKSRKT